MLGWMTVIRAPVSTWISTSQQCHDYVIISIFILYYLCSNFPPEERRHGLVPCRHTDTSVLLDKQQSCSNSSRWSVYFRFGESTSYVTTNHTSWGIITSPARYKSREVPSCRHGGSNSGQTGNLCDKLFFFKVKVYLSHTFRTDKWLQMQRKS